ncbi:MAG: peptidylprolyl isomerase [Elusimicrobiota bacterium]|jgi:parvulin-like peptidyl-prolyl isomerase|nr:peptidylprolyl isomerase [Elusimicrobiota bacterium]
MLKKVSIFGIFLVLFSLFACKSNNSAVIKVRDVKISEEQLNQRLENTPPSYQSYANTQLGRRQFLDSIVRETIMLEAARQAKIDKSKEYDELVKEFKLQQKRQLEEYKEAMLLDIYIKQLQDNMSVSEEEVKSYYNANSEQFERPVSYTVRHILLTDEDEARRVYEMVKRGEDFAKAASEYSQDQASAAGGGLIGPFKIGTLVPEFEKVSLTLKNGEISNIVETDYGYHIIQKISQQTLPSVSFADAEPEIRAAIARDKFERWYENKKNEFGVSVNYDANAPGTQKN